VYALGYSTTIVPDNSDFTEETDPISGITNLTYIVPFVGNTTIEDSTGNTFVYQYPGKTGNIIPIASALYSQGRIRIEK
jgi:hypothetical protein